MKNWIHMIACFVGCFLFAFAIVETSSPLFRIIKLSLGLYTAFQGAVLFVASEIRDQIRNGD